MLEFVTDRSYYHKTLLKQLQSKNWETMTAEERYQWTMVASKAAYNYTDLNRVETAVQVISDMAGLNLTTKTDWKVSDKPNGADMNRYFSNLKTVLEYGESSWGLSDVPELAYILQTGKGHELQYTEANLIEAMLRRVYVKLLDKSLIFMDGRIYTSWREVSSNTNLSSSGVDLGEYLQIVTTANKASYGYYVFGPISLDGISSIVATGTNSSAESSHNVYFRVYVSDRYTTSYAAATAKTELNKNGLGEMSVTLDVSNITGNQYIFVGIYADAWANKRTVRITSVTFS